MVIWIAFGAVWQRAVHPFLKQEAYRAAKEKAVSMGLLVKFLLAGLPPKEVL